MAERTRTMAEPVPAVVPKIRTASLYAVCTTILN